MADSGAVTETEQGATAEKMGCVSPVSMNPLALTLIIVIECVFTVLLTRR